MILPHLSRTSPQVYPMILQGRKPKETKRSPNTEWKELTIRIEIAGNKSSQTKESRADCRLEEGEA